MKSLYKQAEMSPNIQGVRIIGTYINWEQLGVEPKLIAENSARIKGRISYEDYRNDKPLSDEPVAIVGFGPSLAKTWRELTNFRIIFSGSGAHRFLIERGIVPTYHIDSDPHAYKAEILGTPNRKCTYLISSICHPTYFDKLELHGVNAKLWHMLFLEPEIFMHFPKHEWIFTGGHIVGPRMVKMARIMGFKNLHMFGLDASADNGLTHATEHPNPPKVDLEKIEVNGKTFYSNRTWEDHANILFKDLDRMPEVKTTFYGDGMIQEMAKIHKPIHRANVPMMVFKGEDGQCYW